MKWEFTDHRGHQCEKVQVHPLIQFFWCHEISSYPISYFFDVFRVEIKLARPVNLVNSKPCNSLRVQQEKTQQDGVFMTRRNVSSRITCVLASNRITGGGCTSATQEKSLSNTLRCKWWFMFWGFPKRPLDLLKITLLSWEAWHVTTIFDWEDSILKVVQWNTDGQCLLMLLKYRGHLQWCFGLWLCGWTTFILNPSTERIWKDIQ